MKKTLIFYKPEYADLAIKLRDNYRSHDHEETDIVSAEEHDDIEYAEKMQYDEAVFIEDSDTVTVHDIESGYTNRLPVSDAFYSDPKPNHHETMLKQWMQENRLQDPDDIDSLLEAADLTRQFIRDRNYEGINTIIIYTIESDYYECFSWIMDLLQEEFEKSSDYFLDDFACDIGRSIANYDAFVDALQVDLDVQRHDVEKVYDEHGEVAAFFNNFTYNTKYKNIFLGSSENFDTKDNDFIQYKLLFFRSPSI